MRRTIGRNGAAVGPFSGGDAGEAALHAGDEVLDTVGRAPPDIARSSSGGIIGE
jgi:hypothetical protein